MEGIFLGAMLLACPIAMGLMMWLMARGMKTKSPESPPASLESLREEHRQLGEDISRLEHRDDSIASRS